MPVARLFGTREPEAVDATGHIVVVAVEMNKAGERGEAAECFEQLCAQRGRAVGVQ